MKTLICKKLTIPITISAILVSNFLHCQSTFKDTLVLFDKDNSSKMIIAKRDYINEVQFLFRDSIVNSIQQFLDTAQSNQDISKDYYTAFDVYSNFDHDVLFDQVLFNLFKRNKIHFQKDNKIISCDKVRLKTIRVYRYSGVYCGKNRILYCNEILLTSLKKSRNKKTYRMYVPF